MSFEAGLPGDKRSPEEWQMICCRYYTAGKLVSGKKVLEIGCGSGRGIGYLSARAQRLVAGDYSPENLGYARDYYNENAELLLLDARELPFKENTFNLVVAMEVLQYITSIDDFLSECYRLLKKGGTVCLCLPNKDAPGFSASPLGYIYYSTPELYQALSRNNFDARLFGAFPIKRKAILETLFTGITMTGSRVLGFIPGGKKLKEILNERVLGQTIVTKLEIGDSDMIPDNYKLEPLSNNSPDKRHKILYAIAEAMPPI